MGDWTAAAPAEPVVTVDVDEVARWLVAIGYPYLEGAASAPVPDVLRWPLARAWHAQQRLDLSDEEFGDWSVQDQYDALRDEGAW